MRKSEICASAGEKLILPHIGCNDPIRRMALPAAKGGMFSFQMISGLIVIKRLFVHPHNGEIPAMMFFVTFDALMGNKTSMVPGAGVHARPEFRVTAQTIVVCNRLSQRVTLRTFAHPLKGGMRPRELSRGDLPPRRSRP